MTTQSAADAKDIVILAERMGIPADEAMRQVAQLVADGERPVVQPAEPADPQSVSAALA